MQNFILMQDAFNQNPALWLGCCFVLGCCVASFINVVVWRLPIMLNNEWNQAAAEQLNVNPPKHQPLTLSKPDSHCPKCQTPIRWYHNVPLLGWLWLRGQCAACGVAISARYPLVELAGGLLGAAVAFSFPAGWAAFAALALVWVLLTIALIDWDTQLIPDIIVLPLLWAGLLLNVSETFTSLPAAVIGAAAGYGALWACFQGFKLLTGKDGMGYGDFKLLAALGAWFGWMALPNIILVASLSGAAFGITQRLIGNMQAQQAMPFGPWLAVAGLVQLFCGDVISRWLVQ